MAHAIWNGVISFGLLNIPVALHSGGRSTDLHFRMLDSRDNSPIRFERVNAETGEEVPWKQIVKAFEYEKGNYVVLEQEDFKAAAPDSLETVEITSFVDRDAIRPMYYEKPYYLVPGKKAEKGYVLLREVLRRTNRIAMGKVVIRTREYLCGLLPEDHALLMMLLRFPQEIVPADSFKLPSGGLSEYRISPKEVSMAEELVESMSIDFEPSAYVDDFRARLQEVIDTRIRSQEGTVTTDDAQDEDEQPSTNVVDFMALLRKSLKGKGEEGKGEAGKGEAGKTGARKSARRASGNQNGADSEKESKSGAKTGAKTGAKSASKAGAKSGAKSASGTGSKTGARTASKTDAKAGSKTASKAGSTTASKTGSKTGSKAGTKKTEDRKASVRAPRKRAA